MEIPSLRVINHEHRIKSVKLGYDFHISKLTEFSAPTPCPYLSSTPLPPSISIIHLLRRPGPASWQIGFFQLLSSTPSCLCLFPHTYLSHLIINPLHLYLYPLIIILATHLYFHFAASCQDLASPVGQGCYHSRPSNHGRKNCPSSPFPD